MTHEMCLANDWTLETAGMLFMMVIQVASIVLLVCLHHKGKLHPTRALSRSEERVTKLSLIYNLGCLIGTVILVGISFQYPRCVWASSLFSFASLLGPWMSARPWHFSNLFDRLQVTVSNLLIPKEIRELERRCDTSLKEIRESLINCRQQIGPIDMFQREVDALSHELRTQDKAFDEIELALTQMRTTLTKLTEPSATLESLKASISNSPKFPAPHPPPARLDPAQSFDPKCQVCNGTGQVDKSIVDPSAGKRDCTSCGRSGRR